MTTAMEKVFGSGLFAPSYFDVKFLDDKAKEWRERCRKSVQSIRRNRQNLECSRDLYERLELQYQTMYHEKAVVTFWFMYRAAQHNSILVQADYRILKESEAA